MRRTKEETQITQSSILDAAMQVFIRKGYSQTSVEDIVAAVDLTRGAFYWHFKDKEDLLKKLVFREHSYIAGLLSSSLITDPLENESQRLEKLMLNITESFLNEKRYRDYVYLVRFQIEFHPGSFYFKDLKDLNEFIITEIAKLIHSARSNKSFDNEIDDLGISVQIVSMLDGLFRLYFVLPKYLSDKETILKNISHYVKILFKTKDNM